MAEEQTTPTCHEGGIIGQVRATQGHLFMLQRFPKRKGTWQRKGTRELPLLQTPTDTISYRMFQMWKPGALCPPMSKRRSTPEQTTKEGPARSTQKEYYWGEDRVQKVELLHSIADHELQAR